VSVYDLRENRQYLEYVQNATLNRPGHGLDPNPANSGSDEWWQAVADGRIPSKVDVGIVAPEHDIPIKVELDASDRRSARLGPDPIHGAYDYGPRHASTARRSARQMPPPLHSSRHERLRLTRETGRYECFSHSDS
jgi:hypothetical protein